MSSESKLNVSKVVMFLVKCVRLSRPLVGFWTHFKSPHFHFISFHLFAGGWSYLTAADRAVLELAAGSSVSSGTSTFCQRQEDVIVL